MISHHSKSSKKIFLLVLPICLPLLSFFAMEDQYTVHTIGDESVTNATETIYSSTSEITPISPEPINNEKRKNDRKIKKNIDPVVLLGSREGGSMKASEFKSHSELIISPQSCVLKGFRLVYVPKGKDILVIVNPGAKYQRETQRLADKAKPGDKYFYENVKCKCEGEPNTRELTSLAVSIE